MNSQQRQWESPDTHSEGRDVDSIPRGLELKNWHPKAIAKFFRSDGQENKEGMLSRLTAYCLTSVPLRSVSLESTEPVMVLH